MTIRIDQVGPAGLALYDQVPSRFEVQSVLTVEVVEGGLGGFRLVEQPVDPPLRDVHR